MLLSEVFQDPALTRVVSVVSAAANNSGAATRLLSAIATTTPFTYPDNTSIVVVDTSLLAITINLPQLNMIKSGTLFIIKDGSNHAATNSITIAAPALIEGSSTYTINTNKGRVALYYNDTTQGSIVPAFYILGAA